MLLVLRVVVQREPDDAGGTASLNACWDVDAASGIEIADWWTEGEACIAPQEVRSEPGDVGDSRAIV